MHRCYTSYKYLRYIISLNNVYLQRLDGRQTYDYRSIKISFGTDYGCCFVDLGKTRRVFLPFEGKEMTVEQWLSTKATGLSKADR